jgi:hypothetical protein
LTDPGYSRQVEEQDREVKETQNQHTEGTPQQARPAGDQPEKKPEEKEFDWRRALTDPDYSREIRAQERAERQQRVGEQCQEQGLQRTPAGHEP